MSGKETPADSAPDAAGPEDNGEAARERARKKARLDSVFRSMYPGQGSSCGGGFSASHYDEQRPPHHGG